MTSNFTNIIVSDSVVSDTVTTDTLNCNSLAINATNFGVSGSGLFNSIIPYNGLSTTLGASNVIVSGNIRINGNIEGNTRFNGPLNTFTGNTVFNGNVIANKSITFSGNLITGNIETTTFTSTNGTSIAKANVASQIVMDTSGEITLIDLYSHSNISNIFADSRIVSVGGLSNTAGSGTLYIGSRNCFMGRGAYTPDAGGAGNITLNYNSANIQGNLYCNRLVDINGNLITNGNLQVDRNTNMLGNLTVGNILLNQNLSLVGNVLTELDVNGNLITLGNLVVNSTGNISNALTIRSGFKGAVATNKFITYDIAGTGTHYFFDNIESTGNLLVNGNANIVGNITATTIGTLHTFRAIDVDTYYYFGSATSWAYGSFGVTTTLASAGFVQFYLLQSSGLSIGSGWLKLNTTTFTSPKFLEFNFNIDITSALALTTASFTLTTADNSAFTGATTRATTRFARSYGTNEDIQITLGFYIPAKLAGPAEDYIRITYNGSASLAYSSATTAPSNTWWTLKQIY